MNAHFKKQSSSWEWALREIDVAFGSDMNLVLLACLCCHVGGCSTQALRSFRAVFFGGGHAPENSQALKEINVPFGSDINIVLLAYLCCHIGCCSTRALHSFRAVFIGGGRAPENSHREDKSF